jgi:hypothetical protein
MGSVVEGSPPAALAVAAPGAGRKIRSKALKSLISWKEKEAQAAPFRRFWPAFSAQRVRFAGKKRAFPSAKASAFPERSQSRNIGCSRSSTPA